MNLNHLSEEEVARCAEALSDGTFNRLPETLRNHLKECDACAQEVSFVVKTLTEISTEGKPIKMEPTVTKTNKYWLGVAASVVLILGLTILFISIQKEPVQVAQCTDKNISNPNDSLAKQNNTNQTIEYTRVDTMNPAITQTESHSSKKNEQSEINADQTDLLAYAPNEQMEKLVDRFALSTMRGDNIEIKSPTTIKTSKDITLEWVNTNHQKLTIELYNNKGVKLFDTQTTSDNYAPLQLKNNGLYYWKLINEDYDLLFCGKIILK